MCTGRWHGIHNFLGLLKNFFRFFYEPPLEICFMIKTDFEKEAFL